MRRVPVFSRSEGLRSTLIHSDQLRAARALTGISQTELARLVGVSIPTIKRAEGSGSIGVPQRTRDAIADGLRRLGVHFVNGHDGAGRGVRWASDADAAELVGVDGPNGEGAAAD